MMRGKGEESVTQEKKDAYQIRMNGALQGAELAITNAFARAGGDWLKSDYIRGMQDTIAAIRAILNIPDERVAASPYVVVSDSGYNTGVDPDQPFIPPPTAPESWGSEDA